MITYRRLVVRCWLRLDVLVARLGERVGRRVTRAYDRLVDAEGRR